MKLILSGFTVHDAWKKFHPWIYEMKKKKTGSVIVLTSKESFKQIPLWCKNIEFVDSIHPQMSGDGYQINLKIK